VVYNCLNRDLADESDYTDTLIAGLVRARLKVALSLKKSVNQPYPPSVVG